MRRSRFMTTTRWIPAGVQRVIESLNARGLSVFGLEVSYFAGEIETFVPLLAIRPTLGARVAGQDARAPRLDIYLTESEALNAVGIEE
jgi:hypothetical protein